MNQKWSKERNRCKVELIKSELQISLNFEENCSDFIEKIKLDENLLKAVSIIIIYFCHGTAVTITTSLTSKMVKPQELGRLNSIQTGMNFILTMGTLVAYNVPRGSYHHFSEFGHYCLVIFLYVVLTLPILGVFVAFHFKYRDFLTEKTPTKINNSIYTISR
ncbi:uncharacterized protein LOC112679883 [Sipha flava]|uniref:Uncharacterized protein LOC112679883 n=1 Tax=Sipha flava TaxID=143950 RepID=A0A8B8F4N3_9HEMI|nr:uncharacterized protein LOC112679883 [Sipha flava]